MSLRRRRRRPARIAQTLGALAPARNWDQRPSPTTSSSAQGDEVDHWNLESTQERLASRATVAVGAGVVSCLAVTTVIVTAIVASDEGGAIHHGVLPLLGWVVALGVAGVVVATVMAVRVRRAARASTALSGGPRHLPCG